MLSKFIEKMSLYFKSTNEIISYKLTIQKYDYPTIRRYPKKIPFINTNIIKYNQNLKEILKNNFDLPDDYVSVKKVNTEYLHTKTLLLWMTNDDKPIDNLDSAVKEFILLSNELLRKYDVLIKYKKDVADYRFNIRMIQPYIINLVDIRKVLLDIV